VRNRNDWITGVRNRNDWISGVKTGMTRYQELRQK